MGFWLKPIFKYANLARIGLYLVLVIFSLLSFLLVSKAHAEVRAKQRELQFVREKLQACSETTAQYRSLKEKVHAYQERGVEITAARSELQIIRGQITAYQYSEAKNKLRETETLLDQKMAEKIEQDRQDALDALKAEEAARQAEEAARQAAAAEEARKGVLTGEIKEGDKGVAGAVVFLNSGQKTEGRTVADQAGKYSLQVYAGKYTLKVEAAGYQIFQQEVEIFTQKDINQEVKLTRVLPTPTPTPRSTPTPTPVSNSSDSDEYSYYRTFTLENKMGRFTVDLLTVELGSGRVRVVVDTASDEDCSDNCPAMPLKQYIDRHGAFAGVNGTYLCPPDYASCAGKVNSFYYKVYNSRLGKMINANNQLGEHDPFMVFAADGQAQMFDMWYLFGTSGFPIYSGISCRPTLTYRGTNVLNVASLDTKERTTKSVRTGFGLKGTTLYIAVVSGATIVDLAEVMMSLGVTDSLNLDGGGTSALYYKGSYKKGPGRNLPNAVVFVRQ